MSMLFVGIDVSKDYSSGQELDPEGKKLFYLEFGMNGEGFSRLLNTLKTHCKDLSEVSIERKRLKGGREKLKNKLKSFSP